MQTHPGLTLVRAMALSIAVLLAWTIIVFLSSVTHASLFEVVPPDGLVSFEQRIQIDRSITSFFADGQRQRLAVLSTSEQAHLIEVRSLLPWLVGILLLSTAIVWKLGPSPSAVKLSILLTGIGSALVVASFQAVFFAFHEQVFRDAPWVFSPSEYLLTQVYPFRFFLVSWLVIVTFAMATLTTWAHVHDRRHHAKERA